MSDILKKQLYDNINLYYIEDRKYKTVSMSLFLHRHLSRSEATLNALLSKVLRRGNDKHRTMNELNRYAENLYGTLYDINVMKKSYAQSIVSTVNVLENTYADENIISDGIRLMLDLVFKPYLPCGNFNKNYVEGEKQNLKDDIEGLINDKRSYADFRCIEEMCKGEDGAVFEFGYIEDLEKIDEKVLTNHYKSVITSSPIDIFVVGHADIAEIERILKDYFSKYDFCIDPIVNTAKKVGAKGDVKHVTDSFDVAQGKLALGFRTGITLEDDNYYALLLGNSIFGAGAHSRLFNTVREQMSLCYYASSRLDKFRSIMLISSGIEFENFEKAKSEILNQLKKVSSGDFTGEEFEVSRDFIINNYRSCKDSPYLMKDYYLGHCFSSNHDTIDEAIEKIKNVKKDDVIKAMSEIKLDTVYFLKGKGEA